MSRFNNQALTLIRAAVLLSSVSVMALGTVGITRASTSLLMHATTQTANVSHTHNERWG